LFEHLFDVQSFHGLGSDRLLFTHLHVTPGDSTGGDLLDRGLAEAWADAARAGGASAASWTERDGLHGAVRHVAACLERGLAPIVGVELGVLADTDGRRGEAGEAGRVVVLAHGGNAGAGWAALCRLVTVAHARTGRDGKRGPAGVLREELAAGCLDPRTGRPAVTVLIGPDSDVGRAMSGDRFLRPRTLLRQWLEAMPSGVLAVELATPEAAASGTSSAVRMLRLAAEHGVPAVLTGSAASGRLATAETMHALGAQIIAAARMGTRDLDSLLTNTERIAGRCRLDPTSDLGWDTPMPAPPAALGAADEAMEVIQSLGVRCEVNTAAGLIEVEDHELDRVYRALVAHFGAERAALAAAWDDGATAGVGSRGPARHEGRTDGGVQPLLLADRAAIPARRPERTLRPCGLVVGDRIRDRVPLQPSGVGAPMAQADWRDVAHLGLTVVGVRGSRAQSAIAFAVREAARVHGSGTVPADPRAHRGWLMSEHPEALLAGALEHPQPCSAEPPAVQAARLGVPLLPVDIAASGASYRLERITSGPDAGRIGVRAPLSAVDGLSRREAARIIAGRPYASAADVRERARLTHAAVGRLAAAGAFASMHRAAAAAGSSPSLAADLAGLVRRPAGRPPGPMDGQLPLSADLSAPEGGPPGRPTGFR
jgi:hypothetical protein